MIATTINGRRIVKNTIYLYGKMTITTVVLLYTTRLVLNALGDVDYGIFGIVGGVIAMLGFLNTAMASTTQRFFSYAEGEGRKDRLVSLFNNTIILHFIIGLVILGIMEAMCYPLFNGILNIPSERLFAAKCIYHFMAISTMLTIMTVPYDAIINAHEDLIYYSVIGIIEAFLKLGVAIFIINAKSDKLIVYGLLMAAISLIMMIVMRIYCHKHYSECIFQPKRYYNKSIIREIGSFASWNLVGSISNVAGNYGSGILLNHFFGTVVIAAQTICGQIGGQLLVFSNNMLKALNPAIVKSEGEGNRENMLSLSLVGCRLSFLLYSLLAVPFLLKADYILRIWLTNIPEWTVLFCQLQVIRVLLEQLTLPLRMSLMATGSVKLFNMANFVLSIITFCSLYIVYSNGMQPYWLFINSILFLVIIEAAVKLYLCKKYCGLSISFFLKNVIVRCLLCLTIQLVVGYFIISYESAGIIRLILTVLVQFILCILLVYFIGLNKSEKQYISKILKFKKDGIK